ncbi:hypothetical protein [Campylobacter mucosalis]|uniref:hypothetical protein n=1 Tax=Campylobacter mucosalis TaxID=202 RepID=UPI00146FCDAC|nr:hypothetical protein [Campylobacter mucosalis]
MDYNKEDKGFVCAIYNLMKKRVFFMILSLIALGLVLILHLEFDNLCCLNIALISPMLTISAALLLICIKPRNFILRLGGFLIALCATFISLHKLNAIEANTFYAVLVFGFLLLVLLLSWFVYNARSSEINEL